jgi:hypothetical protein
MLMLMLSISYASVNNPMIEQSIFIKTKHKFDIYTSKILITFLFCALLTLFGIILPIIINMRSDFALFDRNPTTIDWVFGAILLLVNGFSGGLIGLFANRRIITKHRTAVLFMSFIGLCTIFKGNISADFFLFKFIAWVLPPVFDLCATYTTNDTIQFNDIGLELLWMLGNNSMLITIYIKIMLYKRFE